MIFDYHVLLALQAQWAAYRDDVAAFRSLWGGSVPDAQLDVWHATLVEARPQFCDAWPATLPSRPVVVTTFSEEPDEQIIGRRGSVTNDAGTITLERALLVGVTVNITITAAQPIHGRALYMIIMAALNGGADAALYSAGFQPPVFVSGGTLEPLEYLFPEQLGMYNVRQSWRTRREHTATSEITRPPSVEVAHVTATTPAGNPGRVTPGD